MAWPRWRSLVGVAQLVEHRVVVPGVAGSSPVTHPKRSSAVRPGSTRPAGGPGPPGLGRVACWPRRRRRPAAHPPLAAGPVGRAAGAPPTGSRSCTPGRRRCPGDRGWPGCTPSSGTPSRPGPRWPRTATGCSAVPAGSGSGGPRPWTSSRPACCSATATGRPSSTGCWTRTGSTPARGHRLPGRRLALPRAAGGHAGPVGRGRGPPRPGADRAPPAGRGALGRAHPARRRRRAARPRRPRRPGPGPEAGRHRRGHRRRARPAAAGRAAALRDTGAGGRAQPPHWLHGMVQSGTSVSRVVSFTGVPTTLTTSPGWAMP